MRKSKIFSNSELKELEKRKKGDKSDKFGLFSSRIKPKIVELLDKWFPLKEELEKHIKKK